MQRNYLTVALTLALAGCSAAPSTVTPVPATRGTAQTGVALSVAAKASSPGVEQIRALQDAFLNDMVALEKDFTRAEAKAIKSDLSDANLDASLVAIAAILNPLFERIATLELSIGEIDFLIFNNDLQASRSELRQLTHRHELDLARFETLFIRSAVLSGLFDEIGGIIDREANDTAAYLHSGRAGIQTLKDGWAEVIGGGAVITPPADVVARGARELTKLEKRQSDIEQQLQQTSNKVDAMKFSVSSIESVKSALDRLERVGDELSADETVFQEEFIFPYLFPDGVSAP